MFFLWENYKFIGLYNISHSPVFMFLDFHLEKFYLEGECMCVRAHHLDTYVVIL